MKDSAFVLITCNTNQDDAVKRMLQEIKEVKEVQKVSGVYDIIMKIETTSKSTLKDLISKQINPIKGIRSTVVLPKERPLVTA